MGIYVELKGEGTGSALGALLAGGAGEGVELISGSAELKLVAELRRAAPHVESSILFTSGWTLEDMIDACKRHATRYAHPCFRPVRIEDWRPMVDALHAADLLIMTPHTNDAAEAHAFAAAGVDVIASDDPRILCGLL
jgi:glycerophosphoryl diester phosphodiesterase